ncbi:Autophagy-related protein 11 [Podosphaera aphanis]|nr:Autophagy-related protein 11 [Podosphaera aphanis]
MALKVLIAHTGQCLLTNPETFASLDAFKVWVSKNSDIVVQDQIPLNSEGRHVKFPGLSCEREIFIYDRRIIQALSSKSANPVKYDVAVPPKYNAPNPPDTISNQNDLQAWKDLFKSRRDWAFYIAAECSRMLDQVQKRHFEMDVIIRGASNAVRNVQKHVTTIDHKNAVIQNWTEEVRKVQEPTGSDWDTLLQHLQSVSVTNDIVTFITGNTVQGQQNSTLKNIVDLESFNKAKNIVKSIPRQLSLSSVELGKKVDEIYRQSDALVDIVSGHLPVKAEAKTMMEPTQVMRDIEVQAKKVSDDCDSILDPHNSMTISQASKCALVHTKSVLPRLMKRSIEMSSLLRSVTEIRNSLAVDSIQVMQQIFSLTSMISDVTARLAALEPSVEADDALQYLLSIKLLPITYASFLAEAIRRRSWREKIMVDSSTLASEMAIFHEEEVKRRRKWQKCVGIALWGEKVEQTAPELSFKLQDTNENWPEISKKNLEELLTVLQAENFNPTITGEISKIISDLDKPTKKQTKRAKAAFKAGSFHENTLGHSTLTTRGDNELICTLQDEILKVESKYKTAESRVRRLENLLHQQSQVNKITIGNMFQLNDHQSLDHQNMSRLPEEFSRRSSVASRRYSSNQGSDEKSFQQKLLSLEAELAAERKRSSSLEKEALVRKLAEEKLKIQLDESNSIKKDLMENFEAHQREFLGERKAFADEIKQLTAQKEDLEEKLDRCVGSNESQNFNCDKYRCNLQNQAEKTWNEAVSEARKAQDQLKNLKIDTKMIEKTSENLEIQLRSMREENNRLQDRSERAEHAIEKYTKIIHESFSQLSPHEDLPENLSSVAERLIHRAGNLVDALKSAKSDAALARTNLESSQLIHTELRSEIEQMQKKLSIERQDTIQLREKLAEKCAKMTTLEKELIDGCLQLSGYRAKIASNEASSNSGRHDDSEGIDMKASNVNIDRSTAYTSYLGTLKDEIRAYHEKYLHAQNQHEKFGLILEARTSRAKDLTQRFYVQNDRLCKLLGRLSYTITREGRSVVIQRLPKPERSNMNDSSDPSSNKRISSGGFEKKVLVEDGDIKLLDWMYSDDPEVESENYSAYLSAMGHLDVEAFCEVVTKRVKDLEYTAKKYSRDARLYREKFHTAQKEAHEKIAFKNFKEGDLALFLPTRNQATGAWAAFNVGAPHYFLKEQDSHKLRSRDWLLARIHKIEDRVVDLSKSLHGSHLRLSDRRSLAETSNGGDSYEDDNPFDLSDGLRWYLIEAAEEKPGAPTTPGLGKSTVASANIDATGSIRRSKKSSGSGMEGINRTLSKNLDSGRGRNNSKKSQPAASSLIKIGPNPIDTASLKAAATTRTIEEGSEAHIIRPSSNHDSSAAGSIDRVLTPENNPTIASACLGACSSSTKKSKGWDTLWLLDLSLESGRSKNLSEAGPS